MTVQLFIPCYVDRCAPHVAHSLCDLLDNLNIAWLYPAAQTCCGQFAFHAGDWLAARRLMRHFFKVFSDIGPIICPSASCVLTVRHHYPQLVETAADSAHLHRLQPLVYEFAEWLSSLLPLPFPLSLPGRIFIHQSCSARQLGILSHFKKLLGLVANLQFVEIPSANSCCGFGGLFSLKQSNLSQAIGSNYLKAVFKTGATALVSPDVGCLIHLKGLLCKINLDLPTYHFAQLIQQAVYHY